MTGDPRSQPTSPEAPHLLALEAREAALKERIKEQDRMLAEAADYLNSRSGMVGMDIGAKITAYRLAQQKAGT